MSDISNFSGLYLTVNEVSVYVLLLAAITYSVKRRSLWPYMIVVGLLLVLGLELFSHFESLKNLWPVFQLLASVGLLMASYGCYKEQRNS